jgi:predicted DNA-binding transcriptional regulator YafY
MDRLERFYRMQGMLKNRRFVRTQEFLDELEVSRATFKRDLDYMKDRMRAPIVYDRHHEAYRFDDAVADHELWQLPGLWFTADELRALLTMDRLLGDLQPGVLSELTGPIRKRLKELLQSGEHSAEDVARRIRIVAIGSRKVEPAHFRVLSTALLSRRRLRIRHLRRQDGDVMEREISPQRLVHYRDNWYLDAWCHKRQALRTFGVDAIESALVVDKSAREVSDDTLDRHFASGYGIFSGADTQQAMLLFSKERARWVSSEIWHPQQDGRMQLDGTYLLKLPYSQQPELVMDVLKYGADVEVLSPPALRAAVASQLQAAARRYE